MDECVGRILNYYENLSDTGSQREVDPLLNHLSTLCEEIKRHWIHQIFGAARDHAIRRYIQFHQAGIIDLSDRIFLAGSKKADNEALRRTQYLLENLLLFIEEHFYSFFDPDHRISLHSTVSAAAKISHLFEEQINRFPLFDVDPDLTVALQQSVTDLLTAIRFSGITRRTINYLTGVLEGIQDIISNNNLNTDNLAILLYRKNFNSTPIENWYRESLQDDPGVADAFSLLPVNRDQGLFPERPAIDLLLADWLRSQKAKPGEKSGKDRTVKAPAVETLSLNLSVAQLAFFVRLCYLEGCFQSQNISAIIRFFTKHFGTKKQSHISSKSFNRAFYGADQTTAAVLQGYLERMSAQIDKLYFPKT